MSSFYELRDAPWQLWLVLGMKFFEGFSFFSLMYILAKYLTDELGFSDVEAGWLFAFCNGMQFPFALALSFVLDSWGVRRMCIIGECILIVSRLALWMVHSRTLVYVVLLSLYPLGTAALLPALVVGVKRFSTTGSRPYAFGIFYLSQNAASLCSAAALHYFRHSTTGSELYEHVLFLGCFACGIGLIGSLCLYNSAAYAGEQQPGAVEEGESTAVLTKFEGTMRTFRSVMFWRFMAVVGSFIMIRAMFGHLSATVPKWMTREFGEDTPYELYVGANPALIIVLVPICTRICEFLQLKTETALLIGAVISGFSPFILAFVVPSTLAVAGFIVVFSMGEALWSPKLYEYTVSVPQDGQEGLFVACGTAPLYLAKFVAGASSGYLLKYYCPQPESESSENGCHSRALWLAIAVTTSVSPVILVAFQKQLFVKSQDATGEDATLMKKAIS